MKRENFLWASILMIFICVLLILSILTTYHVIDSQKKYQYERNIKYGLIN